MEDTLLKVLNIPIATSGNPLGEYTHINNIIGPAIGVGGTIYNLVTLKSTNFHHLRTCSATNPRPAPPLRAKDPISQHFTLSKNEGEWRVNGK